MASGNRKLSDKIQFVYLHFVMASENRKLSDKIQFVYLVYLHRHLKTENYLTKSNK